MSLIWLKDATRNSDNGQGYGAKVVRPKRGERSPELSQQKRVNSNPRSVTAIDRGIGERIRARRLEIGMSQEKLADAIGVTFQQVQKYEKGVNRVAASTLFAIAQALEAKLVSFFPKE